MRHEIYFKNFLTYFSIALARPFASSGLLSKLHLYTTDIDWNEFNRNHIPASHLPSDFNGNLPELKKLNEKTKKLLNDFKEYFIMEDKQIKGNYDYLAEEVKSQKW